MRQMAGIFCIALLCMYLSGCQAAGGAGRADGSQAGGLDESLAAKKPDGSLSLIVATDLHYLSPALTDGGEGFTRMLAKSDGKMTEYVSQITDAFLAEVIEAKPDALILSGDLSFNGEKQSHIDLAKKLNEVRAQGIPVLVIPGNHDIYSPFSFRYEGDEILRTANVSPEEFEEIYKDMGYSEALSRDTSSLSYVYPLSEKVRLLFLDANAVEKKGSVPADTLVWAKEQLTEAQAAGILVISVTHQNAMTHNERLTRGYRLNNFQKVSELLTTYEVPLNLTGHIHTQHIARDENLCEAATGSLSVYPSQYGIVDISEHGDISYRTSAVDVQAWAKASGDDTPGLAEFEATSRERFDSRNSSKIMGELELLEITKEEREAMTQMAADINRMYFAGTLWEQKEELIKQEAWKLFEDQGADLYLKEYLDSLMDDDKPANRLFIEHTGSGTGGVKTVE